ncbi:MAG TPA: hypothetical protein VFQ61_39300 [Polyangiaceae bacterium]|nr:hypothetical protein [Polyangiaceae bacterium]
MRDARVHATLGLLLSGFWLLRAVSAGAQEDGARSVGGSSVNFDIEPAVGFAALRRPTGILEAGFGWLTLPGADICIVRGSDCAKGDTSFEVDAWQLYRPSKRVAFGAGVLLGLVPTTVAETNAPRDHSRRYFTAEGTIRYYPYVGKNVEWWVGLTGGLVVVSDTFKVRGENDSARALQGPSGVTIRTEGGSIGLAGGPVVALSSYWALGATLRYGQWFLPTQPAVDSLGSEASLRGRNSIFSLGVNIAFRLPL